MLSPTAWAARALGGDLSRKRLVVVFMRGAVDGLNVVVPYGEPNYYDSRPTLAIARSGGDGAVVDLDGFFGLHPALAPHRSRNGVTARSPSFTPAARPTPPARISTPRTTWRAARRASRAPAMDG